MKLPSAEKMPYWKTGRGAPEDWIRRACHEIERAGGKILQCLPSAFQAGYTAHVIGFELGSDRFRLVWPVLACWQKGDAIHAMRQAATMLFHDVKARCLAARVFGARWAFHAELLLQDGRAAGELTTPELLSCLPALIRSEKTFPALPAPAAESNKV